jgi:hypothetical protein
MFQGYKSHFFVKHTQFSCHFAADAAGWRRVFDLLLSTHHLAPESHRLVMLLLPCPQRPGAMSTIDLLMLWSSYGPVMVQSLRPWFIASSFKFRFIVTWHDVALCRSRKRETRLNTTVHHTSNSYVICGSVSFFIINYISACQFQPKWSADAFGAKRCSGHVLYWAIREDLPWPTP